MNKYKAIVVGVDYHNELGLIRSLGIKGITPDVIVLGDTIDGYVEHSKYTGNFIRCFSDEDLLQSLSKYEDFDGEIIVFTAGDVIAALLDSNRSRYSSKFHIPGCHGQLQCWLNKIDMCNQAIKIGLNVPEFIVYKKGDNIPAEVPLPCITKALSSIEGGKSDTIVCQSREELISFIKGNENLCDVIQIERYIEKDIEFQLFGISLNDGEEIVIPGHSHIHRPGIQNEYYFPYIENDDSFTQTVSKAKDFIKSVKFSGTFSVEFIRDKNGLDYFLEMNFRNDGNAICVTDAGFNLPFIWFLYHAGLDYQAELLTYRFTPVKFCPDVIYFYHMIGGELSFWEWAKTTFTSNSFIVYRKGDNKPFRKLVANQFKTMLKLCIKKITNPFH